MKKTYVLDTNVLLSDPKALCAFDDNDLIIPLAVLEELDRHKSRQDEVGSCARQVNRELDKMREMGNLFDGVSTMGGGVLRVAKVEQDAVDKLPLEFTPEKVDHLIIAYMLQNSSAILVSKDINVRVKCDALGVKCQDYLKMRVTSDEKTLYTGVKVIETAYEDVQRVYETGEIDLLEDDKPYYPNQIVVIKNSVNGKTVSSSITKVVSQQNGKMTLKRIDEKKQAYGLTPRNKEQKFSLDLLFDDNVKLVTLTGIAGCGKTLLALAAGLSQLKRIGEEAKFEKMLVTRAVQPVGKDIGFLPGTLFEKMDPWLSPVKDNLNFLMSKSKNNEFKAKTRRPSDSNSLHHDPYFSLLMEEGIIEVAAISHIRGRSIPNTFIILDECQNLSIHELKTIITRVGENTKVVCLGDLDQIDNPHVDFYTNGLTYVIEKFKNSPLAGHIQLLKGERSLLATEAGKIL